MGLSRLTRLKTNDRHPPRNQTADAPDPRRAATAARAEAEGATLGPDTSVATGLRSPRPPAERPRPSSAPHVRHRADPHDRNLMRRAHRAGPLGERHATTRRRCAGACPGPYAATGAAANRARLPTTSPTPNGPWRVTWWRSWSGLGWTGSPSWDTTVADASPTGLRWIIRRAWSGWRCSTACR
jgi:pyruvate/2-oxoglutarate dehydrogenase complex dihydrolipoamide acyltransferase (E2) component